MITTAVLGEYRYDALGRGRRTKKIVGSDTTRFVYSGQSVLEEYDGSEDLLRIFVHSDKIDDVAMMEAPDVADVDNDSNTTELKRFYFHGQLIGSVTHVTDPDESVVESYEYGPYGETVMFDASSSSVSASQIGNPFMYTGRRLDEESALYYYRARHYSVELKRFIQRDPIGYSDGPSAFQYAVGRPTVMRDPMGLEAKKDPRATRAADNAANAAKEHDAEGEAGGLIHAAETGYVKGDDDPDEDKVGDAGAYTEKDGSTRYWLYPNLGPNGEKQGWGSWIVFILPGKGEPFGECPCAGDQGIENQMHQWWFVLMAALHEGVHHENYMNGNDYTRNEPPDEKHAEVYTRTHIALSAMMDAIDAEGGDPDCPCGCKMKWTNWRNDLQRGKDQSLTKAREFYGK